ncbi:MAG: SDR family oxidoreductase [Chloroflexi bacterium]|nr:SDR family oxidoreductase [Chloroflexota bacterium]
MVERKLTGKVALVTGGSRGLGRAYVLRLASLGAHVVVNDIDLTAYKEFNEQISAASVMEEVEAYGVRSLGIEADVTDKAAVEGMFQRVDEEFGRLDVLVCNAGGALFGRDNPWAATASEEAYRKTIDLNLMGTIFCCQVALPMMKRQRSGKIVTIGSQAGMKSGVKGGSGPYSVAKAGVIHYTRLLAGEVGAYNINVNCMAPAWILSSRAIAQGRAEEATRKELEAQIALGRLGMPEDCAKVLEFLTTDLSDYVTGQCISVCGGYILF